MMQNLKNVLYYNKDSDCEVGGRCSHVYKV